MANNAIINFLFNTKGALKEISSFQEKIEQTVGAISNSFIGKLGAIGTAVAGFAGVKNLYEKTLAVADLTNKWNDLDARNVSIFSNALSQFGGSSEEAVNALDSVENAVKELRLHGSGAFRELATTVGVSLQRADGSWKNAIDIIGDLRQSFKGLNQDAKVDSLEKLGIYSPAMLKMLTATDKEFSEIRKKAGSFGVIDDKAIESAEKMRVAIATVKQSFLALAMSALPLITPIVDKISDSFQWLATQNEQVRGTVLAVVSAFGFLTPIASIVKMIGSAFMGVVSVVGSLIGIVGKVFMVFKALGAFLVANPWVLALTALITVAGLIIANWDKVKGWFSEFNEWIKGLSWEALNKLIEISASVLNAWEKVKGWFTDFSYSIGDLTFDGVERLRDIAGEIVDAWQGVKGWFTSFGKWLGSFWEDIMTSCSKGVNGVVEVVKDLLGRIPFIGKYMQDELKRVEADVSFMQERQQRESGNVYYNDEEYNNQGDEYTEENEYNNDYNNEYNNEYNTENNTYRNDYNNDYNTEKMNIEKARPETMGMTNNYNTDSDNSRSETITNNKNTNETVNHFSFNIQTNDAQGFGRELMQYLQQNASGVAV